MTKAHIEFEPEWEKCYYFLSRLQKPTSFLLEWLTSDNHILVESLKILFNTLTELDDIKELLEMKQITYNNHIYDIISYDILVKKVSLHAHFTRFFANVCALCTQFESIYSQINTNLMSNKSLIFNLIEPSIRAFALYAQASKCGLWKRNGSAFLNQVYLYNNLMFRNEFLDKDILCMQLAAGSNLIDINEFMIILLDRFNLLDYLTNFYFESTTTTTANQHDQSSLRNKEEDYDYLKLLGESFLELIIYLICERYDTCVSELTNADSKLERNVIHILCIEPACFSNISSRVYRDLEHYTNDIELTNVLNKIAIMKRNKQNSKAIYELKEDYLCYYNPYFYHYTNAERAKVIIKYKL